MQGRIPGEKHTLSRTLTETSFPYAILILGRVWLSAV